MLRVPLGHLLPMFLSLPLTGLLSSSSPLCPAGIFLKSEIESCIHSLKVFHQLLLVFLSVIMVIGQWETDLILGEAYRSAESGVSRWLEFSFKLYHLKNHIFFYFNFYLKCF